MDGIILNYDRKSATGVVKALDGRLFAFKAGEWRGRLLPRRNDRAEFEAEGGEARNIHFPQGWEPAVAALRKAADSFDMGYIAGVYAIVFFLAVILIGILDVSLSMVGIDEGDIQILFAAFVILDILTVAAWMWGSNYKKMRAFASIVAGGGTVVLAAVLVKYALQGGA